MTAYFLKGSPSVNVGETLTSSVLLQQFWCDAMLHDHMFMLLLTAHMICVVSTSSTTQTINIHAVDNTLIPSIINNKHIQPRLMLTASKPSQSLNKLTLPQHAQHLFSKVHCCKCGPGSSVIIATDYGLDGPGIETWCGARFSAPVQTGPGAHPVSCIMGTGSFPGVKSGRGVTLTLTPSSAVVKKE